MKKIIYLAALCLALAACQKDGDQPQNSGDTVEGLYLNYLTNDDNDKCLLALSFTGNKILEIDLYSKRSDSIIVRTTPFSLKYDPENKEGFIYPSGHSMIDSIFICKNDVSDFLCALVFHKGGETFLKDSVQIFSKDNDLASFITDQSAFDVDYAAAPHCLGPASSSELDTTSNVGLNIDFIVPEEGTKAGLTASVAAKWLGTTFLNTTASYGITSLYNCLFKDDAATAENEKKLNEILTQTKVINDKLDNIQKQLKQLDAKFDRTAVTNKISKRNAMYAAIHEVNFRYYNKLKDLQKDKALMADTVKLKSQIDSLIKEWGKTTVDGSPAYTSLKRVTSMILETVSGRNLFQVYDVFAFNTHCWENEGYTDREDFRSSDLGFVAECCFLTKMYYLANGESTMVTENDGYLKQFIEFYEKNPVVRHPDKCICQIAGAHIILAKKARRITYENPTWIAGKGVIVTGDRDDRMNVNTNRILHADQTPKFIRPEEAKSIMQAYGNKEFLTEIFTKHGCCEAISASPAYIPLSSGHTFKWPKAKEYYYSQYDMPQWMEIYIRSIDPSHPNFDNTKLGRMKFSGEKGWRKERFLLIKKTVFDTWRLSYNGWDSQETTQNWWNYDVITRY